MPAFDREDRHCERNKAIGRASLRLAGREEATGLGSVAGQQLSVAVVHGARLFEVARPGLAQDLDLEDDAREHEAPLPDSPDGPTNRQQDGCGQPGCGQADDGDRPEPSWPAWVEGTEDGADEQPGAGAPRPEVVQPSAGTQRNAGGQLTGGRLGLSTRS